MTSHLRRLGMVLIVGTLLLSVGTTGVLAQEQVQTAAAEIRIIDEEITIRDGLVTITDTSLKGPGLPDEHIEHQKVVLDASTVRFDGFHITAFEKDITICRIVVHVDDVGLLVEDVTLETTG